MEVCSIKHLVACSGGWGAGEPAARWCVCVYGRGRWLGVGDCSGSRGASCDHTQGIMCAGGLIMCKIGETQAGDGPWSGGPARGRRGPSFRPSHETPNTKALCLRLLNKDEISKVKEGYRSSGVYGICRMAIARACGVQSKSAYTLYTGYREANR
jgi:hypothetical protein